ncbi:MAG: transferrin-binding protein-like solute binding protein [Neisseria sp.]|nr:transferrin-binding protein-like solute binding protein [Neisseria sp.]
MNKHSKRLSAAGLTLLLGACAGGGSFDTIEVNTEEKLPEKKKIERVAEPRQSTEEQEAFKKPGLGYVMKNVRRDRGRYDAEGEELQDSNGLPTEVQPHVAFDPASLEELTSAELTAPKIDVLKADPNGSGRVFDPIRRQTFPTRGFVSTRDRAKKYHYIRFGHVSDDYPDEITKGPYGKYTSHISGSNTYTFYRGIQPSPVLPQQESVQYRGQWNFISDAKMNRKNIGKGTFDGAGNGYHEEKGDGDLASASDETFQSTADWLSEFTVNFAEKKLTGNLGYRLRADNDTRKLYEISADLKNNRFTGKAKSVVAEDASAIDKELFGQNSDLLEGGFYGPKGEELAGKFLTNDNSLFGVFGAKRDNAQDDSEENRDKFDTLFDAAHLPYAKRAETTDYQDDAEYAGEYLNNPEPRERLSKIEPKSLTNFGYAMKLRFGGKTFDLNEAVWGSDQTATKSAEGEEGSVHFCCGNLSYLRFGTYRLAEQAGGGLLGGLFLQGERTPLSAVPQTGKAQYVGTWSGFIQMASPEKNIFRNKEFFQSADMSGLSSDRLANRSEFDVDFENKSLTGKLISAHSIRVFDITAQLKGNGFEGTAATPNGGFPFDSGNVQSFRPEIRDAKVTGGFYGPNARELGGMLHYNSEKDGAHGTGIRAGAVFGAIRQD